MSVDETLREDLAAETRRANLRRERGIPSLEALGRRRHQIAMVGLVVAVGMLVAILLAAHVIDVGSHHWIDSDVARFAIVGFGIAMVIYAFDQERHLRRVEQQRAQLVALDCDIAGQLLGAGLVLDAVTALHASIELDVVLPTVVDQGKALVGAERGVLFIAEDGRPMEPGIDPDGVAAVGVPIVDLVHRRVAVVAIVEDDTVDVGVPIVADGLLLAALVLVGIAGDHLTEDTRDLLERYGEATGRALANARRHEAAVFLLDVAH
ncbi:MAG: hypothetical protein ACXVJA_06370 [Acidimicrobiia bacterium]